MASTKFSDHSSLSLVASFFATVFIGFGINAILRPANALTFFELKQPTLAAEKNLVAALMVVYGARDIFMGIAIHSAAYSGSRKSMGWTLLAASAVAFVDGLVCWYYVGAGQWNHWGYAPIIMIVGCISIGLFD